ncbi:MAG: rod shape-determining protein RodA [Candidatus Delongbacteria bacterium]|nr:rod shape-determining protein RodA [bacterium]MBL7032971.1 rod shape-determining protein RodA [Candidatus Delongbacteria bacterium]
MSRSGTSSGLNLWLLLAVAALYGLGLLGIWSASAGQEHFYFYRQLLWGAPALVALLVGYLIPARIFLGLAWITYGLTLLLLLLVLLFGDGTAGASRWFDFGNIRFQPSELGKLALVFILARLLADQQQNVNSLRTLLISFTLTALPLALIMLEPDLGTALTYIFLLLPLLIAGGISGLMLFVIISPLLAVLFSFSKVLLVIYLLALLLFSFKQRLSALLLGGIVLVNGLVGMLVPHLWNLLHDYQKVRLLTFINPKLDPLGAGYQIIQSKTAIGSGGLFGKGFGGGTQVQLDFLPTTHTDFIFSVIGEEFGFVGALVVLALFALVTLLLIHYGFRHRNRFSSLTLIGIAAIMFFHVLVNIGMTIGLFPVTGLPLPFLSYGGSFLLSNFFMVGVALNFIRHRREYT